MLARNLSGQRRLGEATGLAWVESCWRSDLTTPPSINTRRALLQGRDAGGHVEGKFGVE